MLIKSYLVVLARFQRDKVRFHPAEAPAKRGVGEFPFEHATIRMMRKYFIYPLLAGIIMLALTLIFSRYQDCGLFGWGACGDLRGWPLPLLEERCLNNCLTLIPNDPNAEISWVPISVQDWGLLFLFLDIIFWYFIMLIGSIVYGSLFTSPKPSQTWRRRIKKFYLTRHNNIFNPRG
ncbi:hypothetical protein A3D77_05565 [Candidatus Gottesmanbacteria bacterium RIFCSPHIGHO2_02_FULL_39_11]|uniref:Uncharacterized protein n=1 Tax=Candidatus Gottesmanbacteria bacterium RIFCSPHIGHO2_02_FULL_39_11 TaxID=1798382 RepID=A0A1F5ZLE4_9BACT|nr:MAG: hypothetical protein A3D77_05565 [Candidatus Gottesmanbacteria bacterium RIFCSPHIGHO2_02_FULL_39_11]